MQPMSKDPNASLDYFWNWGSWLASGETIVAQQILLTGGVTLAAGQPDPAIVDGSLGPGGPSVPSGAVLAWLAGGTPGTSAPATCRITTSAGRTDDRSILLRLGER